MRTRTSWIGARVGVCIAALCVAASAAFADEYDPAENRLCRCRSESSAPVVSGFAVLGLGVAVDLLLAARNRRAHANPAGSHAREAERDR